MVAYTRRITRKGQVTIPVEVRRKLGLDEGDRVDFVQENGTVRIVPTGSVVERTRGALKQYARVPPPTIEELKEAAARAIAEDVVRRMGG